MWNQTVKAVSWTMKGGDHAHRLVDVERLFSHWRDIVHCLLGISQGRATRDHPTGKVLRGQAAAGGCDVAMRDERRVDHLHSRLYHPWLGR